MKKFLLPMTTVIMALNFSACSIEDNPISQTIQLCFA